MFRFNYNKNFRSNNSTSNNVDIAIFSAMKEELLYLEEKFSKYNKEEILINNFSFPIYRYKNTKILLAHTGLGTTFAASALTMIYTNCKPSYVFLTGTAGGIQQSLGLRDVIIAERAFEAEIQDAFTLLKNTPFESCLTHPFKNEPFYPEYKCDQGLLKIAEDISLEDNCKITKGTVVTSNLFPTPIELFDRIKNKQALSIDMETSAFYQVSWLLGLPALAIRGISNLINSEGRDDHVADSDVSGSAKAASTILEKIIDRLIQLNYKNELGKDTSETDQEIISIRQKLNLETHPEGGYFSVFYKAKEDVVPKNKRYGNESRAAGSSIYYLLDYKNFSAWHRLKSDEIWHFYQGTSIKIHTITPEGVYKHIILGNPLQHENANFQACLPAGTWFAAENIDKKSYSLVGCTVSPAFEYNDFELADRKTLLNSYPALSEVILRLTREQPDDDLIVESNSNETITATAYRI